MYIERPEILKVYVVHVTVSGKCISFDYTRTQSIYETNLLPTVYSIYTYVVNRLISPGSSHRMLLPHTVPWLWEPLREQPGNELCSCSVRGHWHQTLVQPPAGQSNTLANTYWRKKHGKQLSSSNGNTELIHSSLPLSTHELFLSCLGTSVYSIPG